jgi:hypothetical protein
VTGLKFEDIRRIFFLSLSEMCVQDGIIGFFYHTYNSLLIFLAGGVDTKWLPAIVADESRVTLPLPSSSLDFFQRYFKIF